MTRKGHRGRPQTVDGHNPHQAAVYQTLKQKIGPLLPEWRLSTVTPPTSQGPQKTNTGNFKVDLWLIPSHLSFTRSLYDVQGSRFTEETGVTRFRVKKTWWKVPLPLMASQVEQPPEKAFGVRGPLSWLARSFFCPDFLMSE